MRSILTDVRITYKYGKQNAAKFAVNGELNYASHGLIVLNKTER